MLPSRSPQSGYRRHPAVRWLSSSLFSRRRAQWGMSGLKSLRASAHSQEEGGGIMTQPLRARAAAKEATAVNVTWQDPGVCSAILSSVFKFGSTEVNSVLPGDFTRHLAAVCIITCLSELGGGSEKTVTEDVHRVQDGTDSTPDVRDSQYVRSCFKTKHF